MHILGEIGERIERYYMTRFDEIVQRLDLLDLRASAEYVI